MRCSRCGSKIKPGVRFCNQCGAPARPKGRVLLWVVPGGVVLLLACAAAAYVWREPLGIVKPPPPPPGVVVRKVVPLESGIQGGTSPRPDEVPAPGGVVGGVVGGITETAPPPPPRREVTPETPQRIRVSGNLQQARLVRQVQPVYPPLAKMARIQGIVRFTVIVGKDGSVQNLQLVSGHPLLVPAAQEAVKQWVYQPTLLNGEPVEVLTQIEVHFTLTQ